MNGMLFEYWAHPKGTSFMSPATPGTVSQEGAMATEVRATTRQANSELQAVQLYRDYWVNFMINKGATP